MVFEEVKEKNFNSKKVSENLLIDITLAEEKEILDILNILEERCIWLEKKGIIQWRNNYVGRYNEAYFAAALKEHKLYVAKNGSEVVGVFLLKEEDKKFWDNDDPSYYIHHFATKLGYRGIGVKILEFIEYLAKENSKKYIRLDCKKSNEGLNLYYQNMGFKHKGSGVKPYAYNLWEKEI